MKEKKLIIPIALSDGRNVRMQIDAQELGELVKKAKASGDKMMALQIFDDDGNKIEIPIKMSVLRAMVKSVDLSNPIIPKGLDPFLTDMTYYFSKKERVKLVGRDHEIEKIWFYISQKKRNNVFLVGPPDVGKTAICREIIRQIATNECPKEFYDTRVLMLNPREIEKIIGKKKFIFLYKWLINFIVKNRGKVILYIEDSFDMLTAEKLWEMLEMLITKHNIPVLTTSLPENMQEYFLEIDSISKYVNIIYVSEPELNEIYPMIQNFIRKKEKEYGIKASKNVVEFGIFSSPLSESVSANPGNVINNFEKAFLEAKRKGKKMLDKKSILSCYDTDLKRYNIMPANEKKATAYHETGHFIATVMSDRLKDQKIAYVTILPMSWFLGLTEVYNSNSEEVVLSRDYYLDHIAMLMAGRIAEQRVKGSNSGACSDLESATRVAKTMIMSFGLSQKNSNRCYEQSDYFLIPEEKKKELDDEIQQILDEGYKRAEKIISDNECLLKVIAEQLVKEEILTGEYLDKIVKKYRRHKEKMLKNEEKKKTE